MIPIQKNSIKGLENSKWNLWDLEFKKKKKTVDNTWEKIKLENLSRKTNIWLRGVPERTEKLEEQKL